IRKHLLEYDNVMNQQRTVVYDLRNKALSSEDISTTVLESIEEAVLERADKFAAEKIHREEWNLRGLADDLAYLLMTPIPLAELETDGFAELQEKAAALGERAYRAREAQFSAPVMRDLERHLYLFTIDEHWRDHLYELDHLKGGIGLRAYGQRDPLIEYKKEAYELFETLMTEVREDFVQRLFRVQLAPEAVRAIEQQPRAPRPAGRPQRSLPVREREEIQEVPHADRRRRGDPLVSPRDSTAAPDPVARLLRLLAERLESFLDGDELAFETLGEEIADEDVT